jgi:hypothetical protein
MPFRELVIWEKLFQQRHSLSLTELRLPAQSLAEG